MTNEYNMRERQKSCQPFWELTYGQAVYLPVKSDVALLFAFRFRCYTYR